MTARWDNHFLRAADECASMSKDPSTKVGAVIVGDDHDILATGFNGFPRGIADTAERLTCREVKIDLIVHAEINTIIHAARHGTKIKGGTMYLTHPPCVRCATAIIQAGLVEVVARPMTADLALRWKPSIDLALSILSEANVNFREVSE